MAYFEYDKQMSTTFDHYKKNNNLPSVIYKYGHFNIKQKPANYDNIKVLNMDTLDAYQLLLNNGYKNPVLLNLANGIKPCWGQILGYSQEEVLFRRTNLHKALNSKYYPLRDTLIYTPKVEVYLNSDFKLLDKIFNVNIITCDAVDCPMLKNGKFSKTIYNMTYEKIENILLTAIVNKHDSIILGAFGCGVFNNPPEQIANIFLEVINKYGGHFKIIYFAVLSINDDENYNIFKNILEK